MEKQRNTFLDRLIQVQQHADTETLTKLAKQKKSLEQAEVIDLFDRKQHTKRKTSEKKRRRVVAMSR